LGVGDGSSEKKSGPLEKGKKKNQFFIFCAIANP